MPVPADWWRLDATGQAELVRNGLATPSELVEAAIDRVEALNPAINAVVTPLYEEGRRIASELPDTGQAFRGVPILLKDAGEELAGTPYYLGTAVLRDLEHRSTRTTEFVRRSLDAGFVPIGKTNVPELSSGFSTEPVAFGPTRNPWDLERAAGGSSGGSAAAVAAGMVSVATGSDVNGSLRVPAACCGIATLRPTAGLVPTEIPGELPNIRDGWTSFVLSRSVRDLSAILSVVADEAAGLQLPVEQLRVGVLVTDPESPLPVHPEVAAAVREVSSLLIQHGHEVDESYPAALEGLFGSVAEDARPVGEMTTELMLRWFEAKLGRPLRDGELVAPYLANRPAEMPNPEQVEAAVDTVMRRFEAVFEWWDRYDLMVMPAMRQPAWPLGETDWVAVGTFPMQFTHIGFPSLVLPVGLSESGLPLGVQLVGRRGADRLLIEVADRLEAELRWTDRWPALALQDPSDGGSG